MAENTINKYYKNNTVKDKDPYGFARFAKGNVQRGQQLTSAETGTAVIKPADTSRESDTFSSRTSAAGPSVQVLKKGLDVYKRNARNTHGTIDRQVNTKSLGSSSGPSTLRTTFSLAGSLKTTAAPGILSSGNTSKSFAANTYRTTAQSGKKSPGPLSSGSGLLAGSAVQPLGGGLLSASKITAPGNVSGGTTLMKQGISQYKSFESDKPGKKIEPAEETGDFIKPGPENLNDRENL